MSEKKKYPKADALAVGEAICDYLKTDTERTIIAGSLRREKKEVGDVEILFIPKYRAGLTTDFFESPPTDDWAHIAILKAVEAGIFRPRQNIRGSTTWGFQNKLAVHVASGIPVDLFACSADKWWVSLVIRTGGKETNLMLTTGAQKMNRKLHAYGAGVEVLGTGEILIPKCEEDLFEFCGVPYREPKDRV